MADQKLVDQACRVVVAWDHYEATTHRMTARHETRWRRVQRAMGALEALLRERGVDIYGTARPVEED